MPAKLSPLQESMVDLMLLSKTNKMFPDLIDPQHRFLLVECLAVLT